MTHTTYIVDVTGILWNGAKAHTSYNFPTEPTNEAISQKSDFQKITSFRVKRQETTISVVRCGGAL